MKKTNDENIALTYEASLRYLIEKSNQRAWLIAFIASFISILSIVAICLLTPLKTVEPYVIKVDNKTGETGIVTILNEENFTSSEVLDKFFINEYVKSREGYYYNILQKDYLKVQLYSSAEVKKNYLKNFEGQNSLVDKLKDNYEIKVNIKSIVLGESAGIKLATVRFKTITKELKSGIEQENDKIATITYDYLINAKLDEATRLENPLGFQVLNYRLDYELGQ